MNFPIRTMLLITFSFAQFSFAKSVHPLLKNPPKEFTKKIDVTASKYKSFKIAGRCKDLNGPETLSTQLKADAANVLDFDVWTNDTMGLMERVVYKEKNQEMLLTLSQGGCEHMGWTYSIDVNEKYPLQNVLKSIEKSLALLKQVDKMGMLSLGHKELEIAIDRFSKNKLIKVQVSRGDKTETEQQNICQLRPKFQDGRDSILCGAYEDPSNYELIVYELPNQKTLVSLNYWYVL